MSYSRLKVALQQIAEGCNDPVGIAAEALRDRRPPRKPWHEPIPRTNSSAADRAVQFFAAWVGAGKPKFTTFSQGLGISSGRVSQLVAKGRRQLAHRKDHPLYKIAYPE